MADLNRNTILSSFDDNITLLQHIKELEKIPDELIKKAETTLARANYVLDKAQKLIEPITFEIIATKDPDNEDYIVIDIPSNRIDLEKGIIIENTTNGKKLWVKAIYDYENNSWYCASFVNFYNNTIYDYFIFVFENTFEYSINVVDFSYISFLVEDVGFIDIGDKLKISYFKTDFAKIGVEV